ncbi:hypothetical protein CNN00560 [Cryptococcus deneoformans JEC21]|uniref:YCII-related domain-containing protein n=1 Tax=Cryptococcus deneoformans (strain JEC21 / ATCC MYA-565) TaxID=214684 RepID=Q5K7A2_CRYD1|nr:hypothetical protein CNN00560 [Cryptococcus neoformans var. neoformans JEC21]AAW47071.1 hypothetical protein CNN00560 [Cryptococcus neoformans var. neoformans JEC21]
MAARQASKLFYAYLPDANNVLARRYEVRPTHLKRAEDDKKAGILEFGRGYLPPANSPLWTSADLPPGAKPIAGSLMIFRMNTIEEVWARIKDDVYWTEGIWDKEKGDVKEFI